jgi:hypothetical protein
MGENDLGNLTKSGIFGRSILERGSKSASTQLVARPAGRQQPESFKNSIEIAQLRVPNRISGKRFVP